VHCRKTIAIRTAGTAADNGDGLPHAYAVPCHRSECGQFDLRAGSSCRLCHQNTHTSTQYKVGHHSDKPVPRSHPGDSVSMSTPIATVFFGDPRFGGCRTLMGCTSSSAASRGPSAAPTSAAVAVKAKAVRRRDPALKPEDFVASGLEGVTFARRPG
jgi:hypothetical protein